MPPLYTKEQLDGMSIEEVQALRDSLAQKVSQQGSGVQQGSRASSLGLSNMPQGILKDRRLGNAIANIVIQQKLKEKLTPKTAQEQLAEMELEAVQERKNAQGQLPTYNEPTITPQVQPMQDMAQQPTQPIQQTTTQDSAVPPQFKTVIKTKTDKFGTYQAPETIETEEYKGYRKQVEEDQKPLAGDTATRYGGVKQGIGNIKKIEQKLSGLNTDQMRDLIYKSNLVVEAANAGNTIIPFGKGLYQMSKRYKAGDAGLDLGNEFMTLSENILRARTGAVAPEPEMVREYARTLLNSFFENPKTWTNKLQTDLDFLQNVGKEIRPLRQNEWGHTIQPLGQYKAGDTRVKDGITYKRNESGEWLPQ